MPILKHSDILQEGKVFAGLQAEIDMLKKSLGELITVSKNVAKEGSGAEAKKRVDLTNQLNSATQKLVLAESEQNKQLALLKVATQQANREATAQAKEALKITGAYEKLAKKTLEAQKNLKELATIYGVNSKQAKNAQKEFDKFEKQLSKVNKAAKDGKPFVGRYTDALKGFGKQLLGAFGIVGGIQLLIDGFKSLIETSKQVTDITQKLRQSFELSKKEAKAYAADILAISDTFEVDYDEVLRSAITVSKEFGISVGQATKLIEEGFLKGSNNSGEFLDILKEYPVQLKDIGLTAEESFALINQQVTAGVYSDKGIDALKEAGFQLRENTKAVQDALKPLDETVRKQIQQEAASGNAFKAMQLLSKELDTAGLTASEVQTIISTVFVGAGEDASSFVKNLYKVETSLKDVAIQATESEQASLRLNKEWDKFIAGVSDSDGIFSKVWATLKNLLAGAIAGVAKLLDLINGYDPAKALRELNDVDLTGEEIYKRKKTQAIETLITQKKYNDAVKLANQILKEGVITQKEYDEIIKKIVKGTKELTAAEKELLKVKQERAKIAKENQSIETLGVIAETKGIEEEIQKIQLESQQETFNKLNENLAAEQKRQFDAELARVQELEDAKREIKEAAIDAGTNYAIEATNSIVDHNLAKTQDEIEAEKDLLKNQLDKGLISEAAYNQKIRDLNNKSRVEEAKADKKKALYDIAIQTAVAVVKALPNLLKVASTIALGSIQALAVAARPIPKFAKGGPIGGKSHSEGGTLIEAEKGEFMINKQSYANAPKVTEMLNKGLITDKNIGKIASVDYNTLIYRQLKKSERTNEQILNAISNGVYQYEDKGIVYTIFATGRKQVSFK